MADDYSNANGFPDGRRGRTRPGDTSRVADYAASTLPVRGPGLMGRRFPQGSTITPLPARRVGDGGSGGTPTLWRPIAAKYVGGGTPPADQAFKIQVACGLVNGSPPANANVVITLPPNKSVFYVWLKAENSGASAMDVTLDWTGNGDAPTDGPPATPPPDPSTGNPASVAYRPLFAISSNLTQAVLTDTRQFTTQGALDLAAHVVDVNPFSKTRTLLWLPAEPDNYYNSQFT